MTGKFFKNWLAAIGLFIGAIGALIVVVSIVALAFNLFRGPSGLLIVGVLAVTAWWAYLWTKYPI